MEGLLTNIPIYIVAALILVWLLRASLRIVKEYERGVIFRLGRVTGAKGPGLFWLIPFIDQMRPVDLRVVTLDVTKKDAI
ncbi:MAG: slipin family protein, partial [Caldilineaceae bacterium SB0675_bin_29]|nr:slipin family protein [Caldilineaceae bacterium SB0675_bin_29]